MIDPDNAWRLVVSPELWMLWMPGVAVLLEPAGRLVAGMRVRVELRHPRGRATLVRPEREGHVQVTRHDPDERLVWSLIAGPRVSGFEVVRRAALFQCRANGVVLPEAILEELDRQSRPV